MTASFYEPGILANEDAVDGLMHHILDVINSVFAEVGVELPVRQYTNVGQAVYDCEQLTVTLGQLYVGTPAESPNTPQPCDAPITAIFTVELTRNVPIMRGGTHHPKPPSAEELSAAAHQYTRDGWLLLEAAKALQLPGIIADLSYSAEEGGMGVAVMTIVTTVP